MRRCSLLREPDNSKACKGFPQQTAQFITKMSAYFSNSNKRLENFRDLQRIFGLKLNKVLASAPTRWISHHACISRLLEQWENSLNS